MRAYRPKYRDKKTGKMVESAVWWYGFTLADKRVRDSTKQTLKTLALEVEKDERRKLERALVLADSALGQIRQDGDAVRSATHATGFFSVAGGVALKLATNPLSSGRIRPDHPRNSR